MGVCYPPKPTATTTTILFMRAEPVAWSNAGLWIARDWSRHRPDRGVRRPKPCALEKIAVKRLSGFGGFDVFRKLYHIPEKITSKQASKQASKGKALKEHTKK